MDVDLTNETKQLKQQLNELIEQAHENEAKLHRFRKQELELISAPSLTALLKHILIHYRTSFSLDTVSLVLHDPHSEIQRFLKEDSNTMPDLPGLLFHEDKKLLDKLYYNSNEVYLGPYLEEHHHRLFKNEQQKLKSIALLPLLRFGEIVGSFNLGSFNKMRFAPESSPAFLLGLSTTIAICLENAINQERVKRIGISDLLTGINNSRFFDQRFREEITRTIRNCESISFVQIEIDNFKLISDQFGNTTSNPLLKEVACITKSQLRTSDVVARTDTCRFSVLLSPIHQELAEQIIERIRANVEDHDFTALNLQQQGTSMDVTVSAGIASQSLLSGAEDVDEISDILLNTAAKALAQAKNAGNNQISSLSTQIVNSSVT